MEKIKTVIFGGSFDPVHVGHLSLASEVVASGLAREMWFVVSPQNPHKEACRLSDENIRLQTNILQAFGFAVTYRHGCVGV